MNACSLHRLSSEPCPSLCGDRPTRLNLFASIHGRSNVRLRDAAFLNGAGSSAITPAPRNRVPVSRDSTAPSVAWNGSLRLAFDRNENRQKNESGRTFLCDDSPSRRFPLASVVSRKRNFRSVSLALLARDRIEHGRTIRVFVSRKNATRKGEPGVETFHE